MLKKFKDFMLQKCEAPVWVFFLITAALLFTTAVLLSSIEEDTTLYWICNECDKPFEIIFINEFIEN